VILLALLLAAGGGEPRKVWADAETNLLGGPSPDGRYLSYVDPQTGDLGVRDLASGRNRRLTANPPGSPEFAYFSVFSRDSARVAYAWFNREKFYELRVVGLKAPGSRVLFRNEEAGFVQPCAWSPDGKHILTLLFRKDNTSQIALIPAAGGPARVLKSLSWVYPRKMDFSPDGRYLVFDETGRDDAPTTSLYLLSVQESRETTLVGDAGNNLFPVWSPDGRRVLFASDRSGTMDLWAVGVEEGRPQGPPLCLRKNLGRFLPQGITASGAYYYGLRAGGSAVWLASVNLAAGRLLDAPVRLAEGAAPEWSPDGRHLALLTRAGAENFGLESRVLSLWTPSTGQWRVLPARLAWLERLRWAPGGRSLLVSGSDRSARRGLFQVDVETGAATPLVRESASTYRGLEGAWSPDGKDLFHLRQGALYRGDQPLYRADTRLHELCLSPDGRWLAFVSRSDKDVLLLLPPGGGEPRPVASVEKDGIAAVDWTPDSRHLLVTTPTSPAPGLWRVSIEGGKPERLPLTLERVGGLRLHPDGCRVAFTRGTARPEVWTLDLGRP
jgi:Tol biopolymer transport system component